jgi:primosomal protein N' (replication factor Y)
LVRVPLGGRRVKGFVVELDDRDPDRLKDLAGVSPSPPIFDLSLLNTLRWAAHHYVAPLSVMLEKAAPPNLAKPLQPITFDPVGSLARHPLTEVAGSALAGRHRPPTIFLDRAGRSSWMTGLFAAVLAAGRSGLIIAPTGEEAAALAAIAREFAGNRVLEVTPSTKDAPATRAWGMAASEGGYLLVGTPRITLWLVRGLAVAAAVEDGRRAMKDRQTPTLGVRDLLRRRSALGRHNLVLVGPTPSIEAIAGGAEVIRSPGRLWPLVEVVDRKKEDHQGLLTERARAALRASVASGRRSFVFAHRRGYAAAMRCSACGKLRLCPGCGSRPDPGSTCSRCGTALGSCSGCGNSRFIPLGAGVLRVAEDLRRFLPADVVAEAPGKAPVVVGSEADLLGLPPQDLVVATDADGLLFGTSYRAAEESLRILVRLAGPSCYGRPSPR